MREVILLQALRPSALMSPGTEVPAGKSAKSACVDSNRLVRACVSAYTPFGPRLTKRARSACRREQPVACDER